MLGTHCKDGKVYSGSTFGSFQCLKANSETHFMRKLIIIKFSQLKYKPKTFQNQQIHTKLHPQKNKQKKKETKAHKNKTVFQLKRR